MVQLCYRFCLKSNFLKSRFTYVQMRVKIKRQIKLRQVEGFRFRNQGCVIQSEIPFFYQFENKTHNLCVVSTFIIILRKIRYLALIHTPCKYSLKIVLPRAKCRLRLKHILSCVQKVYKQRMWVLEIRVAYRGRYSKQNTVFPPIFD